MQLEVECVMGEWGETEAREVSRVESMSGLKDQEVLPKAFKEFRTFLVAMECHRKQ